MIAGSHCLPTTLQKKFSASAWNGVPRVKKERSIYRGYLPGRNGNLRRDMLSVA